MRIALSFTLDINSISQNDYRVLFFLIDYNRFDSILLLLYMYRYRAAKCSFASN